MAVTINGSTGISGVNGSSGTPAVIGSDADTGLYFAAGQVQASLNGTAANVALVSGTAQASTSGTSIDFTGIPSWVKRVTVMFQGVSLSGTNDFLFQLGDSGGIENTGYLSAYTQFGASTLGTANSTSGFLFAGGGATRLNHGTIQFTNLTGNVWTAFGGSADETGARTCFAAGSKTLSATLDRVRITASGADTFDAGTINIMYE
jgi:hypothetical protein